MANLFSVPVLYIPVNFPVAIRVTTCLDAEIGESRRVKAVRTGFKGFSIRVGYFVFAVPYRLAITVQILVDRRTFLSKICKMYLPYKEFGRLSLDISPRLC
jgi:hypothetical protein